MTRNHAPHLDTLVLFAATGDLPSTSGLIQIPLNSFDDKTVFRIDHYRYGRCLNYNSDSGEGSLRTPADGLFGPIA
jgi:hypothetical protein